MIKLIDFEIIKKETLYIALGIVNSNKEYNVLENGKKERTLAEMEEEFLNPTSTSAFIKHDGTIIGLFDYLVDNPNDHYPWLGLLMIHGDYQGSGFGKQAYAKFENEMIKQRLEHVRLGVIKENKKAHIFWKSIGFTFFKTAIWKNSIEILCYEKQVEKNFPKEALYFK